MRNLKLYNRLLLISILVLILGFLTYGWIAPAFADSGNKEEEIVSPTPTLTPTESMIIFEYVPSTTPEVILPTPLPTVTQNLDFEFNDFEMPRDLEVLWLKVLWYCPLRTVKGDNPNTEKIALLWVLIDEFECSKVINSENKVIDYSDLSYEDKSTYNFTWLFPRDWEKLLMRAGDHDWFRTAIESNQPWHESEVNSRIVNLVYDLWQSEKQGMNSGRIVPREYIYYAFAPDSTGANRKLELYKAKEDLQNAERPYTWFLKGTLDK